MAEGAMRCPGCGVQGLALVKDIGAHRWLCTMCDVRSRSVSTNLCLDVKARAMASLDDEQVERIAVRVVALLAEKLGNA